MRILFEVFLYLYWVCHRNRGCVMMRLICKILLSKTIQDIL